MAVADLLVNGGYAVKVAIGAELVYQLTGANMSSPQTGELNAAARAPTIGKWVNLTVIEAVGWIALLTIIDRSSAWVVGGGIAMGGMVIKYRHAISSGLASSEQPTERY